jgi:hypothetical protein
MLVFRNYQSLPTSPQRVGPSPYFAFHHHSPFFFQHQPILSGQAANAPSEETEESEDDEEDDEEDDDRSSVISIETKPNPTAALIKHSIANILSNKMTMKNKRPFSSSSSCMFSSFHAHVPISVASLFFLASTDEQITNKRHKLMAC